MAIKYTNSHYLFKKHIINDFISRIIKNGLPYEVQDAINDVIRKTGENIKETDEMERQKVEKFTKNARDAWNNYKTSMKNIAMIK